MTVATPGGTEVGFPAEQGIIGLDDVSVGDVILPRISIVHKEGMFKDNLQNRTFAELDCIILGLVKQRVFWKKDTEEGDRPLCKSPDHNHGFPMVSDEVAKDKLFPWDKSNFNPADFPPNESGIVTLPCAACVFKEWDKGDWKVPPCAEQHTYPILYNTTPDEEEATWSPAIVTFQKTGIKPSRAYLSSFVQARKPMFTARTKITLTLLKRSAVEYSVPNFAKTGDTDSSLWNGFGEQYLQIQSFLQQAPRSEEDEYAGTEGFDNANTPAPAAPAAQPPAAAPPVQAAAAAPAAPVAATPPPPVAPAAPTPPPAPAPDDSGLPF